MLNNKKSYVTLCKLAQNGENSYKKLVENTKDIDLVSKNSNYDEQYNKQIAMAFWKLNNELKRKNIKSGMGFSTVGTKYEVIPRTRNAGSTSLKLLSDKEFFVSEINCLPRDINYIYYDEYNNEEDFDIDYIKAIFALTNKDLVYMMSVFTSTLVELMNYIEQNHEMLINDIANGKINSEVLMPDLMRKSLNKKLSANKKRSEELRNIFAEETEEPLILRIWKSMSMIATFSLGESSLYEEKLRKYTGNDILYVHQTYASGKSLIATAYDEQEKSYLLEYDYGSFRFIPIDNDEKASVSINELKSGNLYEVVAEDFINNTLYETKDVFRVVGFVGQVPLIRFVYRKEQLINVGGVNFSIDNILSVLKEFEKDSQIKVVDYAICVDNTVSNNRLILIVATENAKVISSCEEVLSDLLRRKLSVENEEYDLMYRTNRVDRAIVKVINKQQYSKIRNMRIKRGIPINNEKAVRFVEYEAVVS